MGSLIMPVFKRSMTTGRVEHRQIDADQMADFRAKGWFDAPDKVPLNPGQEAEPDTPKPVYTAPVKPYGPFGSVHGETPVVRVEAPAVRAAEQPRVNGRFVKAARGARGTR